MFVVSCTDYIWQIKYRTYYFSLHVGHFVPPGASTTQTPHPLVGERLAPPARARKRSDVTWWTLPTYRH